MSKNRVAPRLEVGSTGFRSQSFTPSRSTSTEERIEERGWTPIGSYMLIGRSSRVIFLPLLTSFYLRTCTRTHQPRYLIRIYSSCLPSFTIPFLFPIFFFCSSLLLLFRVKGMWCIAKARRTICPRA